MILHSFLCAAAKLNAPKLGDAVFQKHVVAGVPAFETNNVNLKSNSIKDHFPELHRACIAMSALGTGIKDLDAECQLQGLRSLVLLATMDCPLTGGDDDFGQCSSYLGVVNAMLQTENQAQHLSLHLALGSLMAAQSADENMDDFLAAAFSQVVVAKSFQKKAVSKNGKNLPTDPLGCPSSGRLFETMILKLNCVFCLHEHCSAACLANPVSLMGGASSPFVTWVFGTTGERDKPMKTVLKGMGHSCLASCCLD